MEYVRNNFHGTKAYMKAYPESSEASARSSAPDLLAKPSIQKKISALRVARWKRLDISADKTVQEIANQAFGHIGLVATIEGGELTLREADELGEQELALLANVRQSDHFDKDGNKVSTKTTFQMHDKLKALELLSKHLGLLDGDNGDRKNKDAVKRRLSENISRAREKLAKRGSRG